MKAFYVFLFLTLFSVFAGLKAQSGSAYQSPLYQLVQHSGISILKLNLTAPHFPDLREASSEERFLSLAYQWINNYPAEWKAFKNLEEIKKLNVAWATLGLPAENSSQNFHSSHWEWFTASGISEAKAKQLFPHFPKPVITGNKEADEQNYAETLGAWMRLYPKEYEAFLNAPELSALNPNYTGYFSLSYMPRFLGTEISRSKPERTQYAEGPGGEFDFQLAIRNWHYVFEPAVFEKLYGKDYDFPVIFDADHYVANIRAGIEAKEELGALLDDPAYQKPTSCDTQKTGK